MKFPIALWPLLLCGGCSNAPDGVPGTWPMTIGAVEQIADRHARQPRRGGQDRLATESWVTALPATRSAPCPTAGQVIARC